MFKMKTLVKTMENTIKIEEENIEVRMKHTEEVK